MVDILVALLAVSIVKSTPLVLGALSGVVCERSGVVNIAIEGMMLTAAFAGFAVAAASGSLLAGLHFAGGALTSFKLFDVESGREKKTIDAPFAQTMFLSFGPDDKILASGHLSLGVKFWDVARGNERTFFTASGPFTFNPTGDLLAVETASEVHLYNVAHGDRAAQFSLGHGDLTALQLLFTPEGRHLAALASDGNVYVFRVPTSE